MCVCDRRIDSCVWAAASDSVLNGSWSHMATCQQAGGGNIIWRRKAAAISLREHWAWREARPTHAQPRLTLRISDSHSFCLSPLFSSCTPTSPGLSSHRRSELHYNVCGGFSAVITQRYDTVMDLFYYIFGQLSCLQVVFVVLLSF